MIHSQFWRPLGSQLTVELRSSATVVHNYWRNLLADYPHRMVVEGETEIALTLEMVEQLPPPSAVAPFFVDDRFNTRDFGNLEVYQGATETELVLYFRDAALINLSLQRPLTAQGIITPQLVNSNRFEDTLFTTLAPLLRQHGLYFIHAFGATYNNEGILIVGPSGSGKTTSGLRLMLAEWALLANDGVMFKHTPEGVVALPTPGFISVRLPTLQILPDLAPYVGRLAYTADEKVFLTAQQVSHGRWSTVVPIRRIYFPRVVNQEQCALKAINKAVALAYLMEESLDRWDRGTLQAQWSCLQALVQQTEPFELLLGRDVAALPQLLRPC